MSVTIGTKENIEQEKPVTEKLELTLIDRLKLAKTKLEETYGPIAIFKLPNQKRLFFRAPTSAEYMIYSEKTEKLMWNNQKKNPVPGDNLCNIKEDLVKVCLIKSTDNTIVGNEEDLKKYPACIGKICDKLEELSGSDVEEDFLD
jgi:hypothetical protein